MKKRWIAGLAAIALTALIAIAWAVSAKRHQPASWVPLAEPASDPNDQLKKCLDRYDIPYRVDERGVISVESRNTDAAISNCS
jgi:hypothetical protein